MPPAMASADDLDDEKARASRRSSGNFKPRVSVVGGQKGSGTFRDTVAGLRGQRKPPTAFSWAVMTKGREYYIAAGDVKVKNAWTRSICEATIASSSDSMIPPGRQFALTQGWITKRGNGWKTWNRRWMQVEYRDNASNAW